MSQLSITLSFAGQSYQADLSDPHPIAISFDPASQLSYFHIPPAQVVPYQDGDWVARTAQGASVNVDAITIIPHGQGTHTEGCGHIDKAHTPLSSCIKQTLMLAYLVSAPTSHSDAIEDTFLLEAIPEGVPALVVRTLPNYDSKRNNNYDTNHPPYFHPLWLAALRAKGVKHLVCDLPSVDHISSQDLPGHRAWFTNADGSSQYDATITELAFIPNHLPDGLYLLQLSVVDLHSDASPSTPTLYFLRP